MGAANSAFLPYYEALVKPLSHAVNDGLMTLFFLLIGLEVKRSFLQGELSKKGAAVLPLCAAAGGVIVPGLIYLLFNHGTPEARGWAVPTATDIAFSLGILSLFASRLPGELRVFLMALAVIDDVAAVLIIALFYTASLSIPMLFGAGACLCLLAGMNRFGITRLTPYLAVGVALWYFTLSSGVHATVAGVCLGLLIPLPAPAQKLEHALHPCVAYGIMPLFAFFNAGVPLAGVTWESFAQPLTLGIIAGLFVGKQLGIFGASWLALRLLKVPPPPNWLAFYGVCLLAGIGFTMSLFIGMLAFEGNEIMLQEMRLGVLIGSVLSALAGYFTLNVALRHKNA